MSTETLHPLTRIHSAFNDPDIAYWDGQNRERYSDDVDDWLIDNLIPIGASVLYADPGAGKSFILQSVIHHLIYGTPLGPWGSDGPGRALCMVYDLEGTWKMVQDRGFAITPYGQAAYDGADDRQDNYCLWLGEVIPAQEREAWKIIPQQAQRHIRWLDQQLMDARAAGAPVHLVVIDTLTKFIGPRPKSGANAYEHESAVIDELNRVGLRNRCAIQVIHHTNKAGEISGSTGIGGSAVVTARLDVSEQTDEDRDRGVPREAVLRSTKVRIGAPFVYAMRQRVDGPWEFVDQPPNETLARGQARLVLSTLNQQGSLTFTELKSATQLGGSLSQVLNRLRKTREIFTRYGRWHIRQAEELIRSRPGQIDARCAACGGPMTAIDGAESHPGCAVEPAPSSEGPKQEDPPTDQEEEEDELLEPTAKEVKAFQMLKDAIGASRMHPVQRIPLEYRAADPWPLITERMTGEHRWTSEAAKHLPDGRLVTVLDRNGSYPSAMSSVSVAANLLTHTGPLEDPREAVDKRAGIYLVCCPGWAESVHGVGHPLGRIAIGVEVGDPVWISTPHLQTLNKLAGTGLIPRVDILDSWTGRGTGGLFTKFSRDVRDARERLTGEELKELKRMTSIAIRALWPTQARSPWWRPDWSVSVRAEAATRHWWRAFQAAQGHATVLRLANVDEVVLVTDPLRPLGVPDPYKLGEIRYGEVKQKKVKLPSGEYVASPLRADLWRSTVKGL